MDYLQQERLKRSCSKGNQAPQTIANPINSQDAAGTYQEQTEKIVVLSDLAILAPPRVYALCLGTGGTALFTALLSGPRSFQY
ncbi:hypothetical protein EVAR_56136_1 [Eumeta japonica]|uniref:Uncharacterized protein n=1 Tax=Eumeta variegata TaxID=151549 RepID=A0A4C1ZW45_EUMVA|nr:hypothetical protein EVAR_56136_1 [Eumeta japonica]